MAYTRNFFIGPWLVRLVADFSRPWGIILFGGRFARFAWCWGQAESRTSFWHYRLLTVGPLGIAVGRVIRIGQGG
ncbi:hypothetical protein SAMN04488503_2007 [Humidesulfovibrio mexicanus]|uniref:Uncharacterized protein n=1 Tax=Humidesulfovibrio mexicanus TaxID=147047 RepID=A0A239AIG0_9BACT|nr:hypothetical protein [Humidesulfovibrio mexicanus]SNR95435.1 hypothetical protein SAMN04488503_2007 [Humidesulfovibrio mexicanus]